jgi:hypothetical protein
MPEEEVAPGLFVGSERSDLDRAMKQATSRLLSGDDSAKDEMLAISRRRMELLLPSRRAPGTKPNNP